MRENHFNKSVMLPSQLIEKNRPCFTLCFTSFFYLFLTWIYKMFIGLLSNVIFLIFIFN